jgi:hypothetical protein
MSESATQMTEDELKGAEICGMSPAEHRAWSIVGVSAADRQLTGLPLPSRVPRSKPLTPEELDDMTDEQLAELNPSDLANLTTAAGGKGR